MDIISEENVGDLWDSNADAWTLLARSGHDVFRDLFNTPAFIDILPDVSGLRGLDVGCGEGYNTRTLSRIGAIMSAVDISERFITAARAYKDEFTSNINYDVGTVTQLNYADSSFDFVTAFMSMMVLPDINPAFNEIYRVLKPGGFFQFSITHPCFSSGRRKKNFDSNKELISVEVNKYFESNGNFVDEWIFKGAAGELINSGLRFRSHVFPRTLSYWFSAVLSAGFSLEEIQEPVPTPEAIIRAPILKEAKVFPHFLHVRCKKNSTFQG